MHEATLKRVDVGELHNSKLGVQIIGTFPGFDMEHYSRTLIL